MLRARRDPDDLINNVWIVTDEPEVEAPKKSRLILPYKDTDAAKVEKKMREETKHVFKATLPWIVDTEEEALAAVLDCKTQIEAQIVAEAEAKSVEVIEDTEPDPARDAHKAKEDAFDEGAAQAALDVAVTEGAQTLADHLDELAEERLLHEPQDATVNRVIASLLVGEAGQAVRRQGLDRAALVAKLQERLPPKSAIIRV